MTEYNEKSMKICLARASKTSIFSKDEGGYRKIPSLQVCLLNLD
jgi:hypothetical protein